MIEQFLPSNFKGGGYLRTVLSDAWVKLYQIWGRHSAINTFMFTNLFAISDILLHFETRAAQNVSKTETEFRIFVSLKIKGGRGEMSE